MSRRIATPDASATAAPTYGHKRWLGTPSRRVDQALAPMPGHQTYLGSARRTEVRDDSVVLARDLERLREALYLGCERAPEFGPGHRNLVQQ